MRTLATGVLMSVIALTGSGAGAAPGPADRLLTDFGSRSALSWITVNDNVMGGRSRGGFESRAGILRFTGSTNTKGGGFSSIRSRPTRLDLSGYEGIRLRVRGDGRRYTFRLTTQTSRRGRYAPSYGADFETRRAAAWQNVEIPFRDFRPSWRGRKLDGPALDLGSIDSLGLMIYDKKDGPFAIEVDWIQAYRAEPTFSLASYRWEKRPLLVFAPSAEDRRFVRQVESVLARQSGFEERDMLLVLVPGGGLARAGSRALSEREAGALRDAYGVAPDAFSVRLIGKDGGVKRKADEPVSLTDLFEQIDAMPMRQREMRRGTSR